jgi:CheY-like chemotaxis protein
MQFQFRHHNRIGYPQRHILVCEDNLNCQRDILEHFLKIFDPQGIVQFSVVPGGVAAASIISSVKVDVILLDHDMPEGNGADLLAWLKEKGLTIPVITFSGIPQNNAHMMTLGATHMFNKGDVINGAADAIIKGILELPEEVLHSTAPKNAGVAEWYMNTYSTQPNPMPRYWVTPNLLVGGNILHLADWQHLEKDFGIKAVINVENQPDPSEITNLCHAYVPDEGAGFPIELVRKVVSFAKTHADMPMYVHCHMGASRSPHFAYAILRAVHGKSKEEAFGIVQAVLPNDRYRWGFNHHTASYVKSIEDALEGWTV